MQTGLLFLGTAGDASTMGKQILSSGGIVLIDFDIQLHINPGPGALCALKNHNVNVRNTDVILASHEDILYTGDINALIEGMTIGGLDRKGVLISAHNIISTDSSSRSSIIHAKQQQMVERIIPLRYGDKVGIGAITIMPKKTTYTEDESIGFSIETPHYSIGIVGKSALTQEVANFHKDTDILVIYMQADKDIDDEIEQITKFLLTSTPKVALLTNFSINHVRYDPLVIARKIQKNCDIQTIAVKDGFILNPKSYANKLRQTQLSQL